MTADIDTAPAREPDTAAPIAPFAKRRWNRLRATIAVLVTQFAILVVLLALWEQATSSNRAFAFMFGSPSAIAGFLGQMVRDGSLWRDTSITGLETSAPVWCPRSRCRRCRS